PHDDELVRALVAAADQYIVARERCKTVIAGYHWFGDWGRDTMIALPGLALVTGRIDIAKSVLLEFSRYLNQGMLPNRFPDAGETPEYNTVDATLWYFEAIRALGEYTRDYDLIKRSFYALLIDILDWHERGTRYGIKVDDDGLLLSGEPGVQLTWMDAKVGDHVVTPRQGKAVEIQALWYNAIRFMEELAARFGDRKNKKRFSDMSARAKRSFNKLFWNEPAGCLYDVITEDQRDTSIRPNQILAVSLEYSMLARDKAKRVVEVVERELLTPFGLRSLAPSDPAYRPHYEGGVWDRDTAYHQGTVWPWLMGPFVTAHVRVNGGTKSARERARGFLVPLESHLLEAGLGHISEILDAESPHESRGCVAQAWSVAEVLRAAVESVFAVRPFQPRLDAARSRTA
ncbi:MAG TPA: amylo-alpha-1,6-glucosidase, partial [Blastocatellia bacterium]|nr:amylo-alpha-1,6-glucosidase [Blastocatellia bacterium]